MVGKADLPPGSFSTLFISKTTEAVLSPDGQSLFSVEGEKVVQWEIRTGRRVREYQGHKGMVLCIAVAPDGRRLYSAGADGQVLAWEIPAGRILSARPLPSEAWALAVANQYLATGLSNGEVFILDANELTVLLKLSTESPGILSLALGQEGLAGGGSDGKLYFWQLPAGGRIGSFLAHNGPIWAVAFGPGYVATASGDRTVRIWAFPGGQLLKTLAGYKGTVWDLACLAEGSFLVTASGDLTVRLWDVAKGEEVGTLRAHAAAVRAVSALPARNLFLTSSEDGKIVIWDLNALLSLRPKVVQAFYTREITQSQYILVSFADANGDVIGVKLVVEEKHVGTVRITPGISFDPQVRGRSQGSFGFTVSVSRPQQVSITVILTDATGLMSPPFLISFTVR